MVISLKKRVSVLFVYMSCSNRFFFQGPYTKFFQLLVVLLAGSIKADAHSSHSPGSDMVAGSSGGLVRLQAKEVRIYT